MPRVFSKKAKSSEHTILVVDDSEEVLKSTRLLLEHDGHEVQVASNGPDAVERIRTWHPHLVILDFFMPDMTGEDVVRQVRPFDPRVQILLQTGYASEKPPRGMLHQLDIQGYHDKSDGPEKLLVWVDASLKAYRTMTAIDKSRQGLRYILDVVPDMHKVQNLEELLQGILVQMEGLIGARDGFIATTPEVHGQDDLGEEYDLQLVAGTGRFAEALGPLHQVDDGGLLARLTRIVYDGQVAVDGSAILVPLRLGVKPLGVLYFERQKDTEHDPELLHLFAVQAAMALENCRLFGLATEDDLTHFFVRSFFFKRFDTELMEAARHQYPISLAMVDVDHFKTVNDTAGHQVGDRVLKQVCHALRASCRDFDFLGRFGGDEFIVALPHTDPRTAADVAETMRRKVEELQPPALPEGIRVTVSIGLVTVPEQAKVRIRKAEVRAVSERMLSLADRALYESKAGGRNQVVSTSSDSLTNLLEPVVRP